MFKKIILIGLILILLLMPVFAVETSDNTNTQQSNVAQTEISAQILGSVTEINADGCKSQELTDNYNLLTGFLIERQEKYYAQTILVVFVLLAMFSCLNFGVLFYFKSRGLI